MFKWETCNAVLDSPIFRSMLISPFQNLLPPSAYNTFSRRVDCCQKVYFCLLHKSRVRPHRTSPARVISCLLARVGPLFQWPCPRNHKSADRTPRDPLSFSHCWRRPIDRSFTVCCSSRSVVKVVLLRSWMLTSTERENFHFQNQWAVASSSGKCVFV